MKNIHRYLGLCLSVVMLVVSITGVMLVWKREYLWITIPAARELPSEHSVLAQAAKKIESSYGPNEVLFVRFYSEGLSIHKVFLTDRRYAWHDQRGEPLQVWKGNERFEDWLLDLHHRLLMGNAVGLNIVGFTGLFLGPLMILGLLIWWPWRKSYRVNLVPLSGRRGDLRRSHFETGVTAFFPALLIVITGVILVYPTESRRLLRDGLAEAKPPITRLIERPAPAGDMTWDAAFNQAQSHFPNGTLHWLSYPREDSFKFSIGVQDERSWNRMGSSSISFDASAGVSLKLQQDQTINNRLLEYTYPIHTGKFPTWVRLLLSATGILVSWLCFLGLLAFFKRRR